MLINHRNWQLAAAITTALAATSPVGATDTVAQNAVEVRQEAQIWTTYALSPYLRAYDLGVSVHDGRAVLTGKVEDDVNKDLAKQIALGVGGIKVVQNDIVVESDYKPAPRSSERTYGELIDDASITSTVKSKMLWSRHADGLAAEVETRAGHVTLTGTAHNAAARDMAGRLAASTRGVVKVHNNLVVQAPKPDMASAAKSASKDLGHGVADGWITTKVASTFLYSSQVDGNDIAVSTKAGIVTLKGKVDSGAERALAIELAQNVRGVRGVRAKGLTF